MAEDPNAKTGKLSMDKGGLQAFQRDRVEPFQEQLRKIALDDPTFGPSMGKLIGAADLSGKRDFDTYGASRPLMLGPMLKEEHLHGKGLALNQAIGKSAERLTKIYEEQTGLFKDIVDNLESSIETLFSTQSGNLTGIDGQDFLDVFEDVESRLTGGQSGGGKDKDK
ncbi:type VII secretion system-associated protein [Streptomyces sp. NBC_00654]|uniref:type VII secretion system-associated protein n=1 Tax=Streptomyces sp. NBC_00654 TaxID=2975799 RepID=UPI0022551401|nr:type VII secretion system-associated protein [Streptomyces sp. NBC_00654]MCX4966943.1 type VII secretion system-associated protein [Streptomyces sp. NBC_00654]